MEFNCINNILDDISNSMSIDIINTNTYEDIMIKNSFINKIINKIKNLKNLNNHKLINYDETKMNELYMSLHKFIIENNSPNKTNKTNKINEPKTISYYRKLKKELGYIIYDIYRNSEYNVLLSNIPTEAIPIIKKSNDNPETVNSEVMFDTVEHYIGINTVCNVLQVSPSSYLVKFNSYNKSKQLCDLINAKMIGETIIRADLINKENLDLIDNTNLSEDKLNENFEVINKEDVVSNKEDVVSNKEDVVSNKEDVVSNKEDVSDIKTEVIENVKTEDVKPLISDNKTVEQGNLLIVDIAHGLYNKISGFFSYFRGVESFKA